MYIPLMYLYNATLYIGCTTYTPWSLGPLFLALNTGGAPHRGAGPVPRQGNMATAVLAKIGLAEHMELEVKLVMQN